MWWLGLLFPLLLEWGQGLTFKEQDEGVEQTDPKFKPLGVSSWMGEWYAAENACLDSRALAPLESHMDHPDVPLVPDSPWTSLYKHVNGTLLIITILHGFPYNVYNIAHLGTRAFPMMEGLEQLRLAHGKAAGDIDTVLAWQYKRTTRFQAYDWYEKILQLTGNRGLRTKVLLQEELLLGVCARRVLTVMEPMDFVLHKQSKKWRVPAHHMFSDAASTKTFRDRALRELRFSRELREQKPKCTALIVTRETPQGWWNFGSINKQLSKLLKTYGWSLRVWEPAANFTGHKITLKDQISLFADVSLSIMSVSAENTNIVFQQPGSGVLAVHKCRDGSFLPKMASGCGFLVFESFPVGCLERPFVFNRSINELGNYTMNFQLDLMPPLLAALAALQGTCIPQ